MAPTPPTLRAPGEAVAFASAHVSGGCYH